MIIALVGPTASGKTAASLDLAVRLGVHGIVGADAMQLYRGMDIGTAKVRPEERRGVAHYQIDVLDISEKASVAAYQKHARADIESIDGPVILVGGSGLYVSAVLDEIDFPGTDDDIRIKYEQMLAERGAGELHLRLAQIDPASAEVIDSRNTRRVIRALEVNELTGRSFQPRFPRHTSHFEDTHVFALDVDRVQLRDRIAVRTQSMFDDGLVDETRELRRQGLDSSPTARTATGYAEAIAVLDGEMTRDEAEESVSEATWKLVRKQLTWFRRDPRITWIPPGDDAVATIMERLDQ